MGGHSGLLRSLLVSSRYEFVHPDTNHNRDDGDFYSADC